MERKEFIARLNQMLADLPEEERIEAVSYYEEYFDDAGPEMEARTIEELGSPEKVAAIIRENLYGGTERGGVYMETGYHESTAEPGRQELERAGTAKGKEERAEDSFFGTGTEDGAGRGGYGEPSGSYEADFGKYKQQYERNGNGKKADGMNGRNGGAKALFVALLILFAIPIGAAAIGVIAALIGLVVGAFGVAAAFIAATAVFSIAGVSLIVLGIANLLSVPPVGVLLCGIGFLMFGAGLLFLMAAVFACRTVLPRMIKGIVFLCKLPFRRKEHAV